MHCLKNGEKLFGFAMDKELVILTPCYGISLNFFAFVAAKCYNNGGNGYRCLSGSYTTAWASTDQLDFAFCVLKLLLNMPSLDSVNVISQARIFIRRKVAEIFDKYTRINEWLKWITEE